MANTLEDFVDIVEDWQKRARAPQEIYATDDLKKSEKARESISNRSLVLNGVAPNYEDRTQTLAIIEDIVNRDEAIAMGYFEAHEKEMLSDKDIREQLANNVFDMVPTKTGESSHDKLVDLHRKINKYRELFTKYSKDEIGYAEIAQVLYGFIEKDLEERRAKDPHSKYITSKEAERDARFRKIIASVIVGNEKSGINVLKVLIDRGIEEFSRAFEEDKSKLADYATRNLRERFYRGDKYETEELEDRIKHEEDADKRKNLERDFDDLRRANKLTAVGMFYQAAKAAESGKKNRLRQISLK